jgi:hypothetical protein
MGKVLFHAVESAFPHGPVALGPSEDIADRGGVDRAGPVLGVLGPDNEPGALEDLEVLGHRRELKVQRCSKLVDRRDTVGQPGEQLTTNRRRERKENLTKAIRLVNDRHNVLLIFLRRKLQERRRARQPMPTAEPPEHGHQPPRPARQQALALLALARL